MKENIQIQPTKGTENKSPNENYYEPAPRYSGIYDSINENEMSQQYEGLRPQGEVANDRSYQHIMKDRHVSGYYDNPTFPQGGTTDKRVPVLPSTVNNTVPVLPPAFKEQNNKDYQNGQPNKGDQSGYDLPKNTGPHDYLELMP